jgi:hypothetical protein
VTVTAAEVEAALLVSPP